jgi:cytochrome c oxidase accessory protein FixG
MLHTPVVDGQPVGSISGGAPKKIVLDISHKRARARGIGADSGPVVPQSVSGRIRRIKWAMVVLCLTVYYALPFLRWDRGPGEPNQAVLLDFDHGRLYAFFIEIWPQELYYLTGLLVLAATVLVLANAGGGRLWCGFACPQTVWTDLFLLVERWIEGDRRERLKKRGAPLSVRRIGEVGAKHAAWIAISLATGGALVFYFTDAPTLARDLMHGDASLFAWVWVAIFAGTTYGLAGFAREQVCTFMCPWPRLQGAIWDAEAFTVNYRDYRGEQRMSVKKAMEFRARGGQAGDCVDCNQCVAVCPIGIDIRQGPNFACINCGLCVDACDSVMAKLDRPRGLIDFETWNNIERGRRNVAPVSRLVRPKTVALTAACIGLTAAMGAAFALRSDGSMSVQHDRNPRVVSLSDGSVRNAYTVKLVNKSSTPQSFLLKGDGLGATMAIIGADANKPISIPPNGSESVRVTLTMPQPHAGAVRFVAQDIAGKDKFIVADSFVVN